MFEVQDLSFSYGAQEILQGLSFAVRRGELYWLDIADLAPLRYTQLSGGQRQLVLIARALAQETSVILLDEPTSSLDFHNQVKVWQVLRRIARQGITILAFSHDPNHVAWFCDRVVMLHHRKTVAEGKPREVFQESLLDTLYQGSCQVVEAGEVPVVLPKYISNQAAPRPTQGQTQRDLDMASIRKLVPALLITGSFLSACNSAPPTNSPGRIEPSGHAASAAERSSIVAARQSWSPFPSKLLLRSAMPWWKK